MDINKQRFVHYPNCIPSSQCLMSRERAYVLILECAVSSSASSSSWLGSLSIATSTRLACQHISCSVLTIATAPKMSESIALLDLCVMITYSYYVRQITHKKLSPHMPESMIHGSTKKMKSAKISVIISSSAIFVPTT